MGAGRGQARRLRAYVKTELAVKSTIELTPAEVKRCCDLTFRREGTMARTLIEERRKGDSKAQVVLARSHKGQLLGWGLLRPPWTGFNRPEINVYVRAAARGQGIGKLLMPKLLELSKAYKPYKPEVTVHSPASEGLFVPFKKSVAITYQD